MKNPWPSLPKLSPFILNEDKENIDKFNSSTKKDYKIQSQLYPEPFLGDVHNAKVVLLNLNPGFNEKDTNFHQNNTDLKKLSIDNLSHKYDTEYPFYFLNPKLKDTPGAKWWNKSLKYLLGEINVKKVAQGIACVEYFPYHSTKFGFNSTIYSQDYSFHLVQEAIKRNALIVVMRSIKRWWPIIKKIDCNNLVRLNSEQSAVISQGNCVHIQKIITAIQS